MKRKTCGICHHPLYPDPGHECMLFPPKTMAALYGPNWREYFSDYDTRYRDMRARLRARDLSQPVDSEQVPVLTSGISE